MEDSLEKVAAQVKVCPKCALSRSRTNAVPGEGPVDARVMFIGEGPGFHEDRLGRPFVGASGQYLEQLLASINLKREQVFITNVVKCRPPGNRDPMPDEIVACREYLDRQLALLHPSVVATLGRYSMERFFPGQSISRIHGHAKRVGDVFYLPLYHPAAALRRPDWRGQMEEDFRRIPELLAELDKAKVVQQKPPDEDSFQQLSLF
jgi:uracil-DNA glycosylase